MDLRSSPRQGQTSIPGLTRAQSALWHCEEPKALAFTRSICCLKDMKSVREINKSRTAASSDIKSHASCYTSLLSGCMETDFAAKAGTISSSPAMLKTGLVSRESWHHALGPIACATDGCGCCRCANITDGLPWSTTVMYAVRQDMCGLFGTALRGRMPWRS